MGYSINFNWVLQFKPKVKIEIGGCYAFEKSGNTLFPLNTAIDLIDSNRIALAKIKIVSCKNTTGATTGVFEVVKIYYGEEKSVLSNYWFENE